MADSLSPSSSDGESDTSLPGGDGDFALVPLFSGALPYGIFKLGAIGGIRRVVRVQAARDDCSIPAALFAKEVWYGAVLLAEWLREFPQEVAGKNVLEISAAAALPAIVSACLGARMTVATDYPNDSLVENMRKQFSVNGIKVVPDAGAKCAVCPLTWGDIDVEHVLSYIQNGGDTAAAAVAIGDGGDGCRDDGATDGGKGGEGGGGGDVLRSGDGGQNDMEVEGDELFDVILLAEFLWWDTHAQHANILVSLDNLLSRKKGASVLASWSHHNPGREHLDLEFFERAEEMGFEMSPLRTETKGYSDIGDKEMQPCYLVRMTRRGSPTLHRNE
jgi:predicted nicotinamide N-methyase